MHLQKLVDVLHLRAGTLGDADLALGVEQFGLLAFLGRHRTDDRVHAQQHLVVHAGLRHRRLGLLHARHHARQHTKTAHVLHLAQLGAQVVHVELTLGHALGELLGVFRLYRRRRLLDDGHDVAHAEDTASDALRMERLDRVQLFAGCGKLDRLAGNGPHRQRRTATRITVHAGEDHAGKIDFARERLCNVDRILARQRVDDEQRFLRGRDSGNRLHLVHQRLIDVESACGVEQKDVDRLQLGRVHGAGGDVDRLLPGDDRQRGNARLFAQNAKLFLRRRTIDVQRGHQDLLALLFLQQLADLGRAGGLARPLQADHHDHNGRRGVQVKLGRAATKHLDQRIVDDLDDLLAGRDRLQDRLANGLLRNGVNKSANDGKGNVGLKQRDPHFAHRRKDIFLTQRAAATQAIEYASKPV
ncbi:hypothetical protein NJ75_03926 [Novosphingobium subterraneum]|uniref:NAD-specific glutamate dehydrogenase n=1 Tax=Novosphingobium subterraneum TaxID=48936 RepID=A0A0B8ZAJ3_9SPHN|nr:hypothetical protein NJ75_03926 [Novosphingobium subterraneum]